jgi:MFS family permease
MWTGLHVIVLPKRMEAMFGPAWSGVGLGLITLAGVATAIIVQPTVGAISDYTVTRWGRRKPYIFIGGVLDVVFLWAVATANTYLALVVALILLQFSSNFAQGPFQGYVPDLVPASQVGRASGLMGLMIMFGGIVGTGLVALGYLQLTPGMSEAEVRSALFLPTIAVGLIELVTMVILVLTVHEGRPAIDRGKRSWLQIGLSAWGTDILHERSYVWLVASRLCYLTLPAVIGGFALYMLERSFGLAPDQAAPYLLIIGVIIGAATIVATIPAARLSDRYGRKRVIYSSYALAAIGLATLALAPSLPVALLALVPLGISAGAFLAVDWALLTDIIPKAASGRYMGISNVATAAAGPVGLAYAGLVLALVTDGFGLLAQAPRAAILAMLVLVAVAALTLRFVNETRRED